MGLPVFTDEWAKAWEDKVKESKDFPVFNKGWEGDIGARDRCGPGTRRAGHPVSVHAL